MLLIQSAPKKEFSHCYTTPEVCLTSGHRFSAIIRIPIPNSEGAKLIVRDFVVRGDRSNWKFVRAGFFGAITSNFGDAKRQCECLSAYFNDPSRQISFYNNNLPKIIKKYSVAGRGECLFRIFTAFHEGNRNWFSGWKKSSNSLKNKLKEDYYQSRIKAAITRSINKCTYSSHLSEDEKYQLYHS